MMARHENTRRAILNLAEALLQDKGFNGFSYAHIATELNVKNAAIHYHFPTKEALGCAVIKRYRDRFQLWVNNARIKDLLPQEKINWFFDIYTKMRADNGKVCLVGSLEAEFNAIPESLQVEVDALHRELLIWLQATLQEGREAGKLNFNGEPADKAALILSSLQGGLQMARALGSDMFTRVLAQIRRELFF